VTEENPSEEWRPVVGWVGYYEVSDLGRVRSVDRTVVSSVGLVMRLKGKVLRSKFNTHGYRVVNLSRSGKPVTAPIHRLVLEAFVEPQPQSPANHTRHLDGNKLSNIPSNLKWGTQQENNADQLIHRRAWDRTSCRNGHQYVDGSFFVRPDGGGRVCRECNRDRKEKFLTKKSTRRN
jgi:hypothetical protein